MKILAIDTTSAVAGVAIVEDDRTIGEFMTNFKKNHSETIMPMVKTALNSTETELADIDYIACASGPGSFTGLRIGASTAKGLAFGANKPIVPVPTLDAMAYNIFNNNDIIAPIMDARRNQAYTAFYSWENDELNRLTQYEAMDMNDIIIQLKKYNKKVIFLGDGVQVYKKTIEKSGVNFCFAPAHVNMQRASAVGSLGIKLAKQGIVLPGKDFVPFYLRKSQAERELEKKRHEGKKEI